MVVVVPSVAQLGSLATDTDVDLVSVPQHKDATLD